MPTCFVIMPITTPPHLVERYGGDEDHFLHVLEFLFAPALEKAGYDAISPVASGSDLIQAEIIRNLNEADLALCDMTTLNANVFFELGIRTALNKPVATVRDTFTERIPFDHSMVNCHGYRWEMDPWIVTKEVNALATHVRATVERGGTTNTLWKRLGIEATAQVGSAGTSQADKLDYLVRQIEGLRAERSYGITPSLAPPPADREQIPGRTEEIHFASGLSLPPTSRAMVRSLAEIITDVNAAFSAFLGDNECILFLGRFPVDSATLRRLVDVGSRDGWRVRCTSENSETALHIARLGIAPDGPVEVGKPFAWIA